ncbi:carbohydrate porin [Gammaproteobacteria bacterium]|nr:carbohydrate porin [Gammaproteobacteria bacterium]
MTIRKHSFHRLTVTMFPIFLVLPNVVDAEVERNALAQSKLIAVDLETQSQANFGGPEAVENRIAEDSEDASLRPSTGAVDRWMEWKGDLHQDTGFSFGGDYSALAIKANDSLGSNDASAGMLRLFGFWDVTGRNTPDTGALVWKIEHRHRYADIAPSSFGLGELGYVGVLGGPWSNQGARLSNLYWRQRFGEGRRTLIAGYLDATDYVDTFVGGSPWTGFANLAFSSGSASVFLPNEATPGMAFGTLIGDNAYLTAGIVNAYSDPTAPFDDSLDRLFNDGELFKTLEIGWISSHQRIYQDNTHLTLWHVDDSDLAGVVEGWGAAFSHVRHLDEHWMPFVRGGYAEDGGSLLQKSLSVGVLYQHQTSADVFGLGVNWGEPNGSTFESSLDDQWTVEAFYRYQLTRQLEITPSLELLKDPALNVEHDKQWVIGLRLRLAL